MCRDSRLSSEANVIDSDNELFNEHNNKVLASKQVKNVHIFQQNANLLAGSEQATI